jgi:predicted deacetylase
MKDLPTRYWLENTTTNIDFEGKLKERPQESIAKFAIVTVHDVSPRYKTKIRRILARLDKLQISYNIAIIPLYYEKMKNDIRYDKAFVDFLTSNEREVALHGLYHERNGNVEEFGNLTMKQALKTIHDALKIIKQAGIRNPKVFIPPTWAVNKPTIEALEDLKFRLIETEEEIILLNGNVRLLSTVLNWDLGSLQADLKYHALIKDLFKKQVLLGSKLVRIAIHPKDPPGILEEQCRMIKKLVKMGYRFVYYSQIGKIFETANHRYRRN